MSLNDTPSANRTHIGFFGRRNAGKSSLVNAVTGQELSIVSDTCGTTTDPVTKSMEILPLGPVVIVDTPGLDDEGQLGEMRVRRARQVLNRIDIAVVVVDATAPLAACDRQLLALIREKGIPHIVALNKSDLPAARPASSPEQINCSALTGMGRHELMVRIARTVTVDSGRKMVADLLNPGDLVVLVIPIDEAAPRARLILPEQLAIREVLDAGALALVARDTELPQALAGIGRSPQLVITDSQAFREVSAVVPPEIPLTSFSILMARYKGFLTEALRGAAAIDTLKDGDRVLIAEGCTHHRQCNDIGTVKIPRWLAGHTGRKLQIETSSGMGFPEDLSRYDLVIHCGGCMLTEREMLYRMKCAQDQRVPFTNYGVVIARMTGILERAIAPVTGGR